MNLGIIDIGSNSVRLIIAEIQENGGYKILSDMKESLRLGLDVELYGAISLAKINSTIKTLKNFKNMCLYMNTISIISVATEALRRSSNKDEILNRISNEVNLDVRVLTGDEEAYYDGIAVLSGFYTQTSLVIDIGGSSTEFTLLKNNKISKCTWLPFGAINLTQRYNLQDIITPLMENNLNDFLSKTLNQMSWLKGEKIDNVIAIGGSVRNLGRIDRKRKRYPLDVSSGYSFSDIDMCQLYNLLKSKNLKQRYKVEGLSKDRADIIVASSSILMNIIKVTGTEEIIVSGKGLREGLLCEYIQKNVHKAEDILDCSIDSILCDHNIDKEHAFNVYHMTEQLFHSLKTIHGLDESYEKILKTACLLHDSGISIRYYDHDKHSFYIILNSSINGLSHKDIVMAAYIASCHRESRHHVNIMPFSALINRLDLEVIRKIAILLRISESLDEDRTGSVKITDCNISDGMVTITISGLEDASLEINKAMSNREEFQELFKNDLSIKMNKEMAH